MLSKDVRVFDMNSVQEVVRRVRHWGANTSGGRRSQIVCVCDVFIMPAHSLDKNTSCLWDHMLSKGSVNKLIMWFSVGP